MHLSSCISSNPARWVETADGVICALISAEIIVRRSVTFFLVEVLVGLINVCEFAE